MLEGKEDPLDFVLWKAAKPTEPADAQWDSAYGKGRPGWHIECSAMACALLGKTFDIHGGGADLQFPHHENEIAQSEGANGQPLARYWMHNGFVNIDNEKMSKSLGNFFTIREVLQKFDAGDAALLHRAGALPQPAELQRRAPGRRARRAQAPVHRAGPGGAGAGDDRLGASPMPRDSRPRWTTTSARPRRWPCCSNWRPKSTAASRRRRRACSRRWAAAWASCRASPRRFLQWRPASRPTLLDAVSVSESFEQMVERRIAQRAAAKKAKNFAEADRIRNELLAQGVVLKDSPSGTTWEAAS